MALVHRQIDGPVAALLVTADPGAGGGTAAPIGSRARITTTGLRYHKTAAGDTDWVRAAIAASRYPPLVTAQIVVPDVGGGGTGAATAFQVSDLDGNALTAAVEVLLTASTTQYGAHHTPNANITVGAPASGAVVAAAAALGRWVLRTDATGFFAATLSNAADETVWFSVHTAPAASSLSYRCLVAGCVPDDATWSA